MEKIVQARSYFDAARHYMDYWDVIITHYVIIENIHGSRWSVKVILGGKEEAEYAKSQGYDVFRIGEDDSVVRV